MITSPQVSKRSFPPCSLADRSGWLANAIEDLMPPLTPLPPPPPHFARPISLRAFEGGREERARFERAKEGASLPPSLPPLSCESSVAGERERWRDSNVGPSVRDRVTHVRARAVPILPIVYARSHGSRRARFQCSPPIMFGCEE